jgi:hypothetical protein
MADTNSSGKKRSSANHDQDLEDVHLVREKRGPIFPFKMVMFSDKVPMGADLLVAKLGRTGFLAWSSIPMYRNDVATLKGTLPLLDELVEIKAIVFKTYDRYGVGKLGHDQNFPHLAEFVFARLTEEGAKAFNRLMYRIDSKTGMPLENPLETEKPKGEE